MSTRTSPINTRRSMEVILVGVLTDDNQIFQFSIPPGGSVSDKMRDEGYTPDRYIEVFDGISRISC